MESRFAKSHVCRGQPSRGGDVSAPFDLDVTFTGSLARRRPKVLRDVVGRGPHTQRLAIVLVQHQHSSAAGAVVGSEISRVSLRVERPCIFAFPLSKNAR